MRADLEGLLTLDRLVHEPARLVILTVLAEAESVEFQFLARISGLSKGNLSSHISKLEQAGYTEVNKSFRGKMPSTSLKITPFGRRALKKYRQDLKRALRQKS